MGDSDSIPGLGRPTEGRFHGHPLQYSCLQNPMDRGAWRAIVHGVAKSRTQLKWLSMHASIFSKSMGPLRASPFLHQPTLGQTPDFLVTKSMNPIQLALNYVLFYYLLETKPARNISPMKFSSKKLLYSAKSGRTIYTVSLNLEITKHSSIVKTLKGPKFKNKIFLIILLSTFSSL